MKPQDILFIIILLVLLWKRDPRLFVWAGVGSLIASIPLFFFWVFFTAERFVWYAIIFFFAAIIVLMYKNR